ncbi:sensor histidine kinase [Mariniflexile sp.]|uniref:sensor histidine kinase n=1 Tax=Mariniflexile sp. TaxID=1979402 RepID=UPI003562A620
MLLFKRIETGFWGLAIALLVIICIGVIDYHTGVELSFSFFYIIPIALLAMYGTENKSYIIIVSVASAFCWFFSDFYNRDYSLIFYPIWNTLVRLFIFLIIGLSLLNLKIKGKKLNLINEDLNLLNNEKNKMIGVAAHDLTNPISAINSFSNLLVSDKENSKEDFIEGLTIIESLSTNTLAVLKNLLNVSTIESGKVDLKIKKLNYIPFVKQQLVYNQILASNKKIHIDFNTEIDAIDLHFDNHYLSQVVDNLLSNAIKYSEAHSEIKIKISKVNNNQILTEIIDNGKGIREEELEKLFNYFQKTTTVPTDGESSTGLGLAIAKKIVTMHQGEIGVKSTLNRGSVFYFSLPMVYKGNVS